MINKTIVLLLISLFYSNLAFSQLYDGRNQDQTSLSQLLSQVKPGTILLLGENHGIASHRDQHVEILSALRAQGLKVSVGLEFVNYTNQNELNLYRKGQIDEAEFLTSIKWGGISFDYYRSQLNFPDLSQGEQSLGLNLPRAVSSKISKLGLTGLSEDDLALMPPQFALGRDSYKARFMEAAGAQGKVPDNCFAAQSAWDDTMAWQATEFIRHNPDQVLVVVVGEFHVQYGGGTPNRIRSRLPTAHIVSLSQIWAEGLSEEEIRQELQVSDTEGPRADFIWVSQP